MKVDDLFSRKAYRRQLSRAGIKKLSNGAFADVFQHPVYHNVVVKVVTTKDTGYERYLKWALDNQDNIYVPKIVEVVEQVYRNTPVKFVFMKKLRPLPPSLMTELEGDRLLLKRLLVGLPRDQKNRLHDFYNEEDGASDAERVRRLRVVAKEVGDQDMVDLTTFLLKHSSLLDLHGGNLMMDGRQLVVVDPFAIYNEIPEDWLR